VSTLDSDDRIGVLVDHRYIRQTVAAGAEIAFAKLNKSEREAIRSHFTSGLRFAKHSFPGFCIALNENKTGFVYNSEDTVSKFANKADSLAKHLEPMLRQMVVVAKAAAAAKAEAAEEFEKRQAEMQTRRLAEEQQALASEPTQLAQQLERIEAKLDRLAEKLDVSLV
jgi:DNA anti-recombination protein RmuC